MTTTTDFEYGAEETLDRLLEIIDRRRLTQGVYAQMGEEREPDAPCGGTNCCMIGATWLANGVPFVLPLRGWESGGSVSLPGIEQHGRADLLEKRPELARALAALNEAAARRMRRFDPVELSAFGSSDEIEAFFESEYATDLNDDDLHELMRLVVEDARRILAAA